MSNRFAFIDHRLLLAGIVVITATVALVFVWRRIGKRSPRETGRSLEISVTGILGLTTIVALLIVWKVLAVIELAAFFFCTELLTRNLPTSIRNRISTNCYRKDGSRSSNRTRAETRAVWKLRWISVGRDPRCCFVQLGMVEVLDLGRPVNGLQKTAMSASHVGEWRVAGVERS